LDKGGEKQQEEASTVGCVLSASLSFYFLFFSIIFSFLFEMVNGFGANFAITYIHICTSAAIAHNHTQ